ncbi:izumo sperm-egg fusion protein 1 isoform X1 [Thunnus albacares]|uniref:izumo sperm-egg fusion protein 1 isoform X1 n=1 Tax=Thunnus albacares TaxID=8236 RepID=UPI001CF6429A|nr:izumo sperm-egg fusion protein 1 isoform X1 [Thunnus albacares]
MLLMLVSLLCCVPAAKACLQCDRRIRLLHEDFVLSGPTVNDQIELKKICDHAYVTYRETSQERRGVIDPTTLYRARTEYQSEFDRFLKTTHTGSVTSEAIQIMEKGRKILEKHLDAFIRDGLCPNKCGLLNRRVMDCISCRYKIHICPSPSGQQDCGEYPVQAEEGGQAVLNCFLPWHRLLLGKPEYHYSWAPGVPGTKKLAESDFKTLVVTADSSVILNQLHVDEQGTYRCSLLGRNGTNFYRVTFPLTGTTLRFTITNVSQIIQLQEPKSHPFACPNSPTSHHSAPPASRRQLLTFSNNRGPAGASHRHDFSSEHSSEHGPHSCSGNDDESVESHGVAEEKEDHAENGVMNILYTVNTHFDRKGLLT